MRTAASWALATLVALAAVVGLISFFNSRDDSSLSSQSKGPGKPYRGQPILSPADRDAVKRGNIVLLYRDDKPPAGTQELIPPGGKALERAGQSVVLDREPTLKTALAAVSKDKIQAADNPQDLDEFIQYWLGA